MPYLEKIRAEYENAKAKKKELLERLRELETKEPMSFHQIWVTRDQIAYWEGKAEGLEFALKEFEKG